MDGQAQEVGERVSMEVKLAKEYNLSNDIIQIIVEGLIGEPTAIEFMAFLQWSENIPDIRKMLEGDIKPKFLEEQIEDMLCYLH